MNIWPQETNEPLPQSLTCRHDGCVCGGDGVLREHGIRTTITTTRLSIEMLDHPDEYCPIIREEEIVLDWTRAAGRDLPGAGNACTTMLVAREA